MANAVQTIARELASLTTDAELNDGAKVLEGLARGLRLRAEAGRRYSLAVLVEMIVARLYDNRTSERVTPVPNADQDAGADDAGALRGRIVAVEGLIAAGKTEFVRKLAAALVGRVRVKVLPERVMKKALGVYYGDPAKYAYGSQLGFTALRCNANDVAMAAAGRLPSEYPLPASGEGLALVLADRTCGGDAMFAVSNYLAGHMLNAEIEAIVDAYPTNFEFSVIMFLDVSARRAEWVCKTLRRNASELSIPLAYFEELRLTHYALMRAFARRGAPVLYVYCDDEPLAVDRVAFLEPLEAVGAIRDCPAGEAVRALWADLPEPVYGTTTEADVASALATVRGRYLQHPSAHVRRVAHVRV